MDFYLAGRFSRQANLRLLRDEIVQNGHRCVASWLDVKETEEGIKDGNGYIREQTRRFSRADLQDVEMCDMFILCDDGYPSSGGRNVEFGYALALGKHIVRVGPASNIFTDALCDEEFDNWDDCISYLSCGFTF